MAVEISKVRADRWLWTVRFYRTRTLATEACKRNAVKIDRKSIKPSKEVKVGDILSIKMGSLTKVVRVDGLTEKRVSAALSINLFSDLTTPEAYEKAKSETVSIPLKPKFGNGKPTKKQRRAIHDFLYPDS